MHHLRFSFPLDPALLDDPAFSPDPRSHPHFPLPNALPDRSSPSSESDSPTPTSSTSSPLSTSPSPSPPHSPRPPRSHSILGPLSTNIPRKASMKAIVRRLTTRHNLDRIDELDETDPFGGSYHHDGPYEATGGSPAQPTLPAPRRAHTHRSKRESDPLPVRPGQHQLAYRTPSAPVETGLSLRLEPGQILQPNTIYGSHISSITAVPGQFFPQPTSVPHATRPDPSRRQSLPNPRPRHHKDPPSLDRLDGFQDRQSLPRRAGDCALDIPKSPPSLHDHGATPYVHRQTQKTISPPPRYESRLPASSPPRSLQHILPPFCYSLSTENAAPIPLRHKSVHPLDSSHAISSAFTQSSSSIQNKPLDPPRIRHLPKRLVMPAPLQPQPPQPRHKFPPAEPPSWQDEYPDAHTLHFQGKPAMFSQEPRLLQTKSSTFPAKIPIPDHVPMSQDFAVSLIGNSSTKAAKEAERTNERTRRRRLSKRRSDI